MLSLSLAALLGLLLQQPGARPGDPREALRQVLEAVEGDRVPAVRTSWSRLAGRTPPDRTALLALGSLARLTYDHERADTLLARVLALGEDGAIADYARMEQARSLLVRGRLREAADAFAQALAGAERRGDTTALAEALLGLAVPRSRFAPPAEVLALLERAERLARNDPRLEANVLCQRAALFSRAGRPEARELAEAGAGLARGARVLRQEGACLQVVAQVFAAQGDIDGAAKALGRAAPLFQRGHDHPALASILQWRGYLFNTLGRYGEARADLTAAIEEGDRARAMSPVGWSLINLGMISLGLGDRVTATEQLQRARSLLETQGDEWGAVTARSMLGGVARAAGDAATARTVYSEVLDWGRRTGNVLTQFNMHDALASLAEMTHDWAGAEREYATARALARAHGMTGWVAGQPHNLGRLALRRGDLGAAQRELRGYLRDLDMSQHSLRYATRALLAETYARRGALAGAEAELVSASDELDAWRASLSDHDLRVRAVEFDNGIDPDLGVATVIAALARAGRVEVALALAERHRARELTDQIHRAQAAQRSASPGSRRSVPLASGADAVRALPDEATALLEYVTGRGGEPTTLFVVSRAGIVAYELASIDSLEADLRRFTTVLEGGGDARPLGAQLAASLLQPAIATLDPRVTRLIIVPDDVLARVAFDALVLADGRYAVERYVIGLVPSASTLVALRSRATADRPVRMLALGDPRFAPTDAATGRESVADPATPVYRSAFAAEGGLPRLAASGREARRVARYAPTAEVRLGDRASEAFIRSTPLGSFRVLHFATHALVDEEAVTRTALALAPGEGEDGFLGPADLAALDLEADLVVLSACRTAGGVVLRGEGIQGLTAPLLQAGARSVVATGWRIADASAGRMVEAFYAALASGSPVGDALRAAKLDAIRRGATPSEWAAFVAVGDPTVRVPLVAPASLPWPRGLAAAAGAALVLFLAYGWMRKRSGAEAA